MTFPFESFIKSHSTPAILKKNLLLLCGINGDFGSLLLGPSAYSIPFSSVMVIGCAASIWYIPTYCFKIPSPTFTATGSFHTRHSVASITEDLSEQSSLINLMSIFLCAILKRYLPGVVLSQSLWPSTFFSVNDVSL